LRITRDISDSTGIMRENIGRMKPTGGLDACEPSTVDFTVDEPFGCQISATSYQNRK